MPEEILPHLYRLQIPLPKSPLKALNSYLIRDGEHSLLIDTGMQAEACRREMLSQLHKLDVDLGKMDFFITHMHADHLGLLTELAGPSAKVYFNAPEAAMIGCSQDERAKRWQWVHAYCLANGFPQGELKRALEGHMGYQLKVGQLPAFHILQQGDTLQAGDYYFTCVETPGHSPGHLCLYEGGKKLLICGDHILFDITPNITFWPEIKDSLGDYLASLDKVYGLEVNLALPGHRNPGNNHRKRIRELRQHHQARLGEILNALQDGEKTAFEIAPHVSWDIQAKSWEEFPAPQKWFAVGETIAHLHYLEIEKKVRRISKGKGILFALA